VLGSVFFGGGTPSLMPPATVAAVLERALRHWRPAPNLEVTLEANPTSAEAGSFAGFRAAGVNRLSLGVQALEDAALRLLGRGHDAAEARAALALAARTFPRWSFDLIYGRPGQSVAGWRQELRTAAALAGGHLSAYQLTLEPGTAFFARDDLELPDEDLAAALYETTQEELAAAGLPGYEISNHARPGEACRHNLTYWRGGEWVGIGPGAHGRLHLDGAPAATIAATITATAGDREPGAWLAAVEESGCGGPPPEPIAATERLAERLMMGLRLHEGLSRRGPEGDPVAVLDRAALERLVRGGFLVVEPGRLLATAAGRLRLNAVLARLV
jgi:oxygen-independent coproporphyrinogen-3 oxidase